MNRCEPVQIGEAHTRTHSVICQISLIFTWRDFVFDNNFFPPPKFPFMSMEITVSTSVSCRISQTYFTVYRSLHARFSVCVRACMLQSGGIFAVNGGGKLVKIACSCHLIIIKIYAGPYCKISFEILCLRIEEDKSSTETQRQKQKKDDASENWFSGNDKSHIWCACVRVCVYIPYKVL